MILGTVATLSVRPKVTGERRQSMDELSKRTPIGRLTPSPSYLSERYDCKLKNCCPIYTA